MTDGDPKVFSLAELQSLCGLAHLAANTAIALVSAGDLPAAHESVLAAYVRLFDAREYDRAWTRTRGFPTPSSGTLLDEARGAARNAAERYFTRRGPL